ncbi:unnamed protein product, partial [Mesorhabditis belari]|uniref:Uncharacterized protein n=1 Tax=Mesorhabditis belari TaxID=2138241 RepID=A0AAF3FB78_9BILA
MPLFLMCALDFVTKGKLKKLRQDGKASRTEELLMMQMLANSFLVLWNDIVLGTILAICQLFFGFNVVYLWFIVNQFNQFLLFDLVASLISAIFLRKRQD